MRPYERAARSLQTVPSHVCGQRRLSARIRHGKGKEYNQVAQDIGAVLTIAGGISTEAEVAALDAKGMESQVGMALYTDMLPL